MLIPLSVMKSTPKVGEDGNIFKSEYGDFHISYEFKDPFRFFKNKKHD